MDTILIQFVILFVSLVGLMVFSDKLIDSSSKLAKAYGISEAVIGLTLLAYGTSLPELTVSSISAVELHSELAVSNVVGSNIINIAIVLGFTASLHSMSFAGGRLSRDASIMAAVTLLFVFSLYYFGGITRAIGVVMIVSVLFYTVYVLKHDLATNRLEKDDDIPKIKEILIIIGCFIVVVISGKFVVDSAVGIARGLEISEWVIGATLVAAGSSLPEISVSVSAAKKGMYKMCIGNIVGSNILNILLVLGFASVLNPININFQLIQIDSVFLTILTLLLTYHVFKRKISRIEGAAYITIYLAYILYIITL